jgi:hypothetical protein
VKPLCQVVALCGLLVVTTVALAASEQAVRARRRRFSIEANGSAIAEKRSPPILHFPPLTSRHERPAGEDAISAIANIDAQHGNVLSHNNLGVL